MDGFEWDVLEENIDLDDLNEKEKYYIKKYKTFGKGYNSEEGGRGWKLTKESEAKRWLSLKRTYEKNKKKYGFCISPEKRKNRSIAAKGKIISKKTREKVSKIFKCRLKDKNYKNKRDRSVNKGIKNGKKNPFYGKTHSKESIKKMAITNHKKGINILNSSGFKGVQKAGKKWRVSIRCGGESLYFGCFEDKVEAAKVYDAKLIELYGKENVTTNKDLGLY